MQQIKKELSVIDLTITVEVRKGNLEKREFKEKSTKEGIIKTLNRSNTI